MLGSSSHPSRHVILKQHSSRNCSEKLRKKAHACMHASMHAFITIMLRTRLHCRPLNRFALVSACRTRRSCPYLCIPCSEREGLCLPANFDTRLVFCWPYTEKKHHASNRFRSGTSRPHCYCSLTRNNSRCGACETQCCIRCEQAVQF